MSTFSEEKISEIWEKAQIIKGYDAKVWRKDVCDAWINRKQYSKDSDYGWEIDHAFPESLGGTDHTDNLRPMHWRNNRSKGDNFPSYSAVVTSKENKNIEKMVSKTVNEKTLEKLKKIYPNNKVVAST